MRAAAIPQAFGSEANVVYVTGAAAGTVDYVDIIDSRMPVIFAFVLGLSFLLLMVVFRSIVVPIKAILMNLLSVGAAYGLLVAVFQNGFGADLLGFQQTHGVTAPRHQRETQLREIVLPAANGAVLVEPGEVVENQISAAGTRKLFCSVHPSIGAACRLHENDLRPTHNRSWRP